MLEIVLCQNEMKKIGIIFIGNRIYAFRKLSGSPLKARWKSARKYTADIGSGMHR